MPNKNLVYSPTGWVKLSIAVTTAYLSAESVASQRLLVVSSLSAVFMFQCCHSPVAALYILLECKVFLCVDS